LLDILRRNIQTGLSGHWTPIQYGKRAGSKALQGTEDQWTLDVKNKFRAELRPKRQFLKIWRGHMRGKRNPIEAKKKAMHFVTDTGEWFLKKVTLPKRDPRPTLTQVKRIGSL